MKRSPSKIIDTANAFYDSCVLFSAIDLGVFTVVETAGKITADEAASKTGCDRRGMRLLLDACTAIGLLVKNGEAYSNTEDASTFLVRGKLSDLSGAIRYNMDVYKAWGGLSGFIRSGKPAERPEVHLGEDKERTRNFVMSMHFRALAIGQVVLPLLDLRGRRQMFDIGGGPAAYACLVAKAEPAIKCKVMDLPGVVEVAGELVAKTEVRDRIDLIAGDYHHAEFPGGNDVVNIFGVLHQESPEEIVRILKKAHASMEKGGVIHILDMMTDATHTAPRFSALFAVNMALTTHNGWVFSDEEMRGWLTEAGFGNISTVSLEPAMPHWLMKAYKNQQ